MSCTFNAHILPPFFPTFRPCHASFLVVALSPSYCRCLQLRMPYSRIPPVAPCYPTSRSCTTLLKIQCTQSFNLATIRARAALLRSPFPSKPPRHLRNTLLRLFFWVPNSTFVLFSVFSLADHSINSLPHWASLPPEFEKTLTLSIDGLGAHDISISVVSCNNFYLGARYRHSVLIRRCALRPNSCTVSSISGPPHPCTSFTSPLIHLRLVFTFSGVCIVLPRQTRSVVPSRAASSTSP